jgi:hypothetical protein
MRNLRTLLAAGLAACFLLAPLPALAATKSKTKQYGEARPDQALVYIIREKRFVGSGRTMFVYADDQFLGAVDNDSYTYAYVTPGKHLLWLNWTSINAEAEFEAGKTYYYAMWSTIDPLDEASGRAYVEGIGSYATATPDEIAKGDEHIEKRYGKAQARAAKKPDEDTRATNLRMRESHIAKWPKVDLGAYPALCVEPFVMADAKAEDRAKQYQVDSAPQRLSELVLAELGTTAFTAVRKGDCGNAADTVVLRSRITQYKPGNDTARFMLAGAGSAQIEMIVDLVAADSGKTLVQFEPKGLWAWGGAVGASRGITDLEKNVAYEVAAYLKRARGEALPEVEAAAAPAEAETPAN